MSLGFKILASGFDKEYKMKNEFTTYHPIVNLIYFVLVIGFSCFFLHPACLIASFLCAFIYSVMLGGVKSLKTNLIFMFPVMIFTAILNPLFNHEGVTIILYFPNGNPLTAESIYYGIAAAIMLVSVILWFSCYNKIMTSDKFIYVFGKIIPSLSLMISMTLRFVPRFISQFKLVSNAQKCIGRDVSNGKLVNRAKNIISIMSIMLTWSLENAVDTADSMRSRGYGLSGRTAFSIYAFDKRDLCALLCIMILGIYVFIGAVLGKIHFDYFPTMRGGEVSTYSTSIFVAYFLLCICPVIIEVWEVQRWKFLRSKI